MTTGFRRDLPGQRTSSWHDGIKSGRRVNVRPTVLVPGALMVLATLVALLFVTYGVLNLSILWSIVTGLALAGVLTLTLRGFPIFAILTVVAGTLAWGAATRAWLPTGWSDFDGLLQFVGINLALVVPLISALLAALAVDALRMSRLAIDEAVSGRRWWGELDDHLPRLKELEVLPAARFFALGEGGCTHLVATGRRVALFLPTVWPHGEFSMDASGQVLRNGRLFVPGSEDLDGLAAEVQTWREQLGKVGGTVRGFLIVAPSRGDVSQDLVIDVAPGEHLQIVHAHELVESAGRWLAAEPYRVDLAVMERLLIIAAGNELPEPAPVTRTFSREPDADGAGDVGAESELAASGASTRARLDPSVGSVGEKRRFGFGRKGRPSREKPAVRPGPGGGAGRHAHADEPAAFDADRVGGGRLEADLSDADHFGTDRFGADSHDADRFNNDRFGTDQFNTDRFGTDRFDADQSSAHQFGVGRFAADGFGSDRDRTDGDRADGDRADRELEDAGAAEGVRRSSESPRRSWHDPGAALDRAYVDDADPFGPSLSDRGHDEDEHGWARAGREVAEAYPLDQQTRDPHPLERRSAERDAAGPPPVERSGRPLASSGRHGAVGRPGDGPDDSWESRATRDLVGSWDTESAEQLAAWAAGATPGSSLEAHAFRYTTDLPPDEEPDGAGATRGRRSRPGPDDQPQQHAGPHNRDRSRAGSADRTRSWTEAEEQGGAPADLDNPNVTFDNVGGLLDNVGGVLDNVSRVLDNAGGGWNGFGDQTPAPAYSDDRPAVRPAAEDQGPAWSRSYDEADARTGVEELRTGVGEPRTDSGEPDRGRVGADDQGAGRSGGLFGPVGRRSYEPPQTADRPSWGGKLFDDADAGLEARPLELRRSWDSDPEARQIRRRQAPAAEPTPASQPTSPAPWTSSGAAQVADGLETPTRDTDSAPVASDPGPWPAASEPAGWDTAVPASTTRDRAAGASDMPSHAAEEQSWDSSPSAQDVPALDLSPVGFSQPPRDPAPAAFSAIPPWENESAASAALSWDAAPTAFDTPSWDASALVADPPRGTASADSTARPWSPASAAASAATWDRAAASDAAPMAGTRSAEAAPSWDAPMAGTRSAEPPPAADGPDWWEDGQPATTRSTPEATTPWGRSKAAKEPDPERAQQPAQERSAPSDAEPAPTSRWGRRSKAATPEGEPAMKEPAAGRPAWATDPTSGQVSDPSGEFNSDRTSWPLENDQPRERDRSAGRTRPSGDADRSAKPAKGDWGTDAFDEDVAPLELNLDEEPGLPDQRSRRFLRRK